MSAVITPFEGTELFNTESFNNRISQINTGFSYVSNPNLLDNWYFGRPVNQRGQTEYTGPVYGIDRWVGNRDQTITIADNYLNIVKGNDIASGFSQFLPREKIPTGATVTLSFLIAPGTQKCQFGLRETNNWSYFAQAVVQTDQNNYQLVSVTIPDVTLSTGNFVVWLSFEIDNPGSVMRPKAAKLELGSQQTLAHREGDKWVLNEIPDYGEQLRRCQRYALALSKQSGHSVYGSGMINSGQNARIVVPLPVTMRTAPTVTKLGDLEIIANGTVYAVTSVSVETLSPSAVCLLVNSASLSTTQAAAPALLRSYGGGKGELFLSADL